MDGRRPTDAEVIAMVAEFHAFGNGPPTARKIAAALSTEDGGYVSARVVSVIVRRLWATGLLVRVEHADHGGPPRWALPRPKPVDWGAAR